MTTHDAVLRRSLLKAGLAGLGSVVVGAGMPSVAKAVTSGPWKLAFSSAFPVGVPLGGFDAAGICTTSQSVAATWSTYPEGWPDTATQRGYAVGGLYDPATTVWFANGQMHITLWRGASGPVHSCAMLPLPVQGRLYGRYVETFRVSKIAPGYKSAHMLVNYLDNPPREVDYPENEWDQDFFAFVHAGDVQQSFDSGATWGSWHTTEIQWTPGQLTFLLDGMTIGTTNTDVPSVPMDWVIQNESALLGESAAPNSSAQMDIAGLSYYEYVG